MLKKFFSGKDQQSSTEPTGTSDFPGLLAGFSPRRSSVDIPGISLVHCADKHSTRAGERLVFTTWIVNSTSETLKNVILVPRSFTNENHEHLAYETLPGRKELRGRTLRPRASLQYSFSYKVTPQDVAVPGVLISAVKAQLTSATWGSLYSQCDATVVV